jgi:hypothetical protein
MSDTAPAQDAPAPLTPPDERLWLATVTVSAAVALLGVALAVPLLAGLAAGSGLRAPAFLIVAAGFLGLAVPVLVTLARADWRRLSRPRQWAALVVIPLFHALTLLLLVALIEAEDIRPGPAPPLAAVSGTHFRQNVTASFVAREGDGEVALLVLANFVGGSQGGSDVSGSTTTFHRTLTAPTGRQLTWHWSTRDGRTGPVTIEDSTFDVGDGWLFLVTVGGGRVEVRQLRREPIRLQQGMQALDEFMRSDPEVARFVAAAQGP